MSSGLLPFALGIVLTPLAAVALQRFVVRPGVDTGAVLALSAAGLLAAHSSALFGAILFALPLVVQRWYRAVRGRRVDGVPDGKAAWRVAGGDVLKMIPVMAGAGLLAAPHILGAITFTSGSYPYHPWGSHMAVWKALAMLATFKQVLPVPQIWLTVFLAFGALTLVALRRLRWVMLSALGLSALFVVVACFGGEDWVISLSRPWWNDRFRLMALAAIPMCLIAAHGMSEAQRWLAKLADGRAWVRARPWLTGRVGLATAVLIVVAMGVLTGGFYRAANAKTVSLLYYNGLPGEVVPPVSQDEIDAMDRLGTLGIPGDQKVLNDRLDGTAWMYALTGVHPVAAHYDSRRGEPRRRLPGGALPRLRHRPPGPRGGAAAQRALRAGRQRHDPPGHAHLAGPAEAGRAGLRERRLPEPGRRHLPDHQVDKALVAAAPRAAATRASRPPTTPGVILDVCSEGRLRDGNRFPGYPDVTRSAQRAAPAGRRSPPAPARLRGLRTATTTAASAR